MEIDSRLYVFMSLVWTAFTVFCAITVIPNALLFGMVGMTICFSGVRKCLVAAGAGRWGRVLCAVISVGSTAFLVAVWGGLLERYTSYGKMLFSMLLLWEAARFLRLSLFELKERGASMRRRMTYRPSKGASIFGGIVGIIFVIIGLTMAIPMAGLFGILWTAIAVGITIYNFYLAFGNGNAGSITIDEEDGAKALADRLSELQALYDQRLITKEEYEEKRKEILKDL